MTENVPDRTDSRRADIEAALHRAATRARELARNAGRAVVVYVEGKVCREIGEAEPQRTLGDRRDVS